MKRRDFLKLSGSSVGLPAVGLVACNDDDVTTAVSSPEAPFNLMDFQPKRVESVDGVLNYDMVLTYAQPAFDGVSLNYRTFNGRLPPDTLVVKPGDTMNVNFINNLPKSAEDNYHPSDINIPHGFNNANLHTHGMNVSPAGDEDNVLLVIHPGESFSYHTHIPEDHPSGHFWYHTHKHGSATHQLASGMAGSLMVEGGSDDLQNVPEIAAATSVDLIFHELIFNERGETPAEGAGEAEAGNPNADLSKRNPITSLFTQEAFLRFAINGVAVDEGFISTQGAGPFKPPYIKMRPGEVQHWRFGLHCHLQTYKLQLQDHKINVVAWDGITADEVEEYDTLVLGPANRVDLLIKASDTPGTYPFKMLFESYGEQEIIPGALPLLFSPGLPYFDFDTFNPADAALPMFNVIVEGEPMAEAMYLPATLNPPSQRLPYILDHEITRRRNINFLVTGEVLLNEDGSYNGDTREYFINNLKFNAARINETMLLNTAEEWTLTNEHPTHQFPQINHPFHIHVNWIQVMEIHHHDGRVEYPNNGLGRWVDNIEVPHGGKVVIRHRFENFTGIFPFHCHVIAHEDEGMMQLVEVVDPSPVTAKAGPNQNATIKSRDFGRMEAGFPAGAFAEDTTIVHYYQLDPEHPVGDGTDGGLIGLERYFALESHVPMSGPAAITLHYPIELSHGEKYDNNTVKLYRSDGNGGWTREGITTVSQGDGSIKDGAVELPTRVIKSQITSLEGGYFALAATQLSGPVTTATSDGGGHGHS
ncbi:MAG: multicopper oxidase family protein [Thiolinea sp.]